MNTLDRIAVCFGVSTVELRAAAIEVCAFPSDTAPGLIDTWLEDTLASSLNRFGSRFHFWQTLSVNVREQLEYAVGASRCDFAQCCARSLAELAANPIRHEPTIEPYLMWRALCKPDDEQIALHEHPVDILAVLAPAYYKPFDAVNGGSVE